MSSVVAIALFLQSQKYKLEYDPDFNELAANTSRLIR